MVETERNREKLQTEYLEILAKKEEEKKTRLKKFNITRAKLMKNIIDKGIWCSEDEIDENLKKNVEPIPHK